MSNNDYVWKKITFAPITTSKIRVLTNASPSGWSELTEVEAWGTAATVSGASPSDVAMARIDPRNRTGTGGEDLLSNNFNWNLPLVGLPGRGLDLGLTLSYNSLVWIRSGNYMTFDADAGSIAPGFRLGFPTIEGPYWNPDASANFYLLVTPSGGRVELRQIGSSTVYESQDSSYLKLTDNLNSTATLRPTDGSQMTFIPSGGGWRCSEIKDRNGNFITVTYKTWGEIGTVTDTLGRVLTFNYDTNENLQSITQMWGSQTHTWATFGWGAAHTMQTGFSGVTTIGPANGAAVPVLRQVGLHDGTYFTFNYNGAGQVNVIRRYTSDNVERSRASYDYGGATDDCPRLTQTRVSAEYWTGFNGVPNEVATQFAHDADGACRMTAPDGTIYKEYYGSSWQSGLTTRSEVWSAGVRQKWTTTAWTQDNETMGYLTNPRVLQRDVEDSSGNQRRTTIDYGAVNLGYVQWGLPHIVREYGVSGSTAIEFRRTQTDYNLDANYLNRRIIGLPQTNLLYDGGNNLMNKSSFVYDLGGEFMQGLPTAPIQHDASYATEVGRGNLVKALRWDVNHPDDSSKVTENKIGYDIAGNVRFTRDALNHQTTLSYTDSFSVDGITPDAPRPFSTFAYPTSVTDGDGFSSTARYRYDFGAKTRVEGPPPQNQPNGIIQTFSYDAAARLERVTTLNIGAYTRYAYGPNYVQSFSTVNTIADEAYSITGFDGGGRVNGAARNHPGSAGGYSAQDTIYDVMGRVKQQSNPTEINGGWVPAGDDAYNAQTGEGGWRYTQQIYDWQGRPLITTNQDGTYKEASYNGCGCAGGEVVTLTDEVGRGQKVYTDSLGRQTKTEVLNWNGTVYSTTTNTYNARDQVTLVRQWAGAENGGGAYQDTTMSYDGYGRLQSKHVPEQNAGTATVYAYNPDNTILSVTDARGVTTTLGYNSRHLLTSITYPDGPSLPAGVSPTSNVTFGYDAAGNRTLMTDGLGSQSYNYDSLSRMTSETRNFNGVGTLTLGYDYNLAGQLKTITDPWSATINYGLDASGRLNNISGSSYGSVTQFASNMQYRAWGTLKSETFGNGFTQAASYNSRMQMTSFEVRKPTSELQMSTATQFYADGQVKFSHNALDERFDRAFAYDHVGRAFEAFSGSEARDFVNNSNTGALTGAYRQTFQFNAFNNITQQMNRLWNAQPATTTNTYTNNRMVGSEYDAEGFATAASGIFYRRDAGGNNIETAEADSYANYGFDGDGRMLKAVRNHPGPNGSSIFTTQYWLNSTMLGRLAVAELNFGGQRQTRFIYASGRKIAEERYGNVTWSHTDPLTASRGDSNVSGGYYGLAEFNADGINIGFAPPVENGFINPEAGTDWPLMALGSECSNADPNCQTCYVNGFENDCSRINWEEAEQCPDNDCGPRSIWKIDAQRFVGVLPLGRDPNTGQWIVSGTVDQYGKVDIKIGDETFPGTWKKVGTRDVTFGVGQQKTACGLFVELLLKQTFGIGVGPLTQENAGRLLARWATGSLTQLAEQNRTGVPTGFKQEYIQGGQNSFAMVHIALVAGGTLIGDSKLRPWTSEPVPGGANTGTELVKFMFDDDTRQLNLGKARQAAGYPTTGLPKPGIKGPGLPPIPGYRTDHRISEYIAEKTAELNDDGAGVTTGRILERAFRQKGFDRSDARKGIFDLLCDR